MVAETAMQVGEPKFRLPVSEKACPFSFLSLVHLTISHGGEGVSESPGSRSSWLLTETLRLCPPRKAGEEGRGECRPGDEMRD